ncbi:MAG: biotin/lipoyl-binding protein, partial [Gemmatimonadaceae bacterium]
MLPDIDDRRLPGSRIIRRAVTVTIAVVTLLIALFAIGAFTVRLDVTIDANGSLEPLRVWPIRASRAGTVSSILVAAGDSVQEGQLVARLDTLELSSVALQLNAQVETARLTLAHNELSARVDQQRALDDLARGEAAALRARAILRQRLTEYGLTGDVDSLLRSYAPGSHVAVDVALSDVLTADVQVRAARAQSERSDLSALVVQRARAELRRLEAEVATVRQHRRRLGIHAPARGTVLTEMLERLPGSVVHDGDVLMEVVDTSRWLALLTLN